MSLTYQSPIRNRIYQRKFDHEEARELYAQGNISIAGLAQHYGVTHSAVARVISPEIHARMYETSRRYIMSGVCVDCGKTNITKRYKDHVSRCKECASILRRTTIRDNELRCCTCKEWKPDDAFGISPELTARRQRKSMCKACGTLARRRYRDKHRVPCEAGCGKMVEGKGRTSGNDPNRPYICIDCWRQGKRGRIASSGSPENPLITLYPRLPLLGK